MINPDKLENALAKIEQQKKQFEKEYQQKIVAELEEAVSENPLSDIEGNFKQLSIAYRNATADQKALYEELYNSLASAVQEHFQILFNEIKGKEEK